MRTSEHTIQAAGHDIIGFSRDDTLVSRLAPEVRATTHRTNAQQEWLRLFERPHHHNYRQHERVSSETPTPLPETLPIVGGDHDVVEAQPWPHDIVYVTNNVFAASQPYPTSKRHSTYYEDCGCEGERCISDSGTRTSSSCINANQDIVCDDSICLVGPECGNRMIQRNDLDLITTCVGLGVTCNVTIQKNAFVAEYVGEVLLGSDAMKRIDKRYQVQLKTKACWDGPTDIYVDAGRCGNESHFVNHSCSPNCALYELEWTNTARLGIFAKAEIPPLRELTIRYRESNLSLFTCQCGRPNCISDRP